MHNRIDEPADEETKRNLIKKMWRFACKENDSAIHQYITVAFAPYGPAEAFRSDEGGTSNE